MSILATALGGGVLSKIGGWIGNYFTTRQQAKQQEVQLKMDLQKAKTEAQIELYKTGLVGDIAWEQRAQDNAGWKDEFLVIVFSIPLIAGFIPGLDTYILQGFNSFSSMPDWYQGSIGVIVASVFGIRKFADIMSLKKGVSLSNIEDVKKLIALKKDLQEVNKKDEE